ncbi:hypothetical protein ACRAWF_23865 [Streptomyces sp. L7]
MAWLDCGSGAGGLDRGWELGPDGAHGLSEQQRDAVRFRVAQGITGRPGSALSGWRRWAEEAFHPPQPWRGVAGGGDPLGGHRSRSGRGLPLRCTALAPLRPDCPAWCCRACAADRPGSAWSSSTSGSVSDAELGSALLEVTRDLKGPWAAAATWLTVVPCDAAAEFAHPLCRAEGIPLLGGGGTDLRTGFRASALRAQPLSPTSSWSLTDGQTPGRSADRRAGRWWDCSRDRTRTGPTTRTTPTTCRTCTARTGPAWVEIGSAPVSPMSPQGDRLPGERGLLQLQHPHVVSPRTRSMGPGTHRLPLRPGRPVPPR